MPRTFVDPLDLENPTEVVSSKITYDGNTQQAPVVTQSVTGKAFIDPLDLDDPADLKQGRSWLTNFAVDSISDVGVGLGAIGGGIIGAGAGGFGALAGAPVGAVAGGGIGTLLEGKVREWLKMPPQDQLIAASEDPELNDFVNTLGLDLAGGVALKGITKGAGAVAKGIGGSVSGATDEAIKSARRLSEKGIDLQSAPAFESGNTGFFSSETLARMFAPDVTEKTRKGILKSQHEGFEQITDTSIDNLTPEGTFDRGREVIESSQKAHQELLEDRGKLQLIKAQNDSLKELIDKGPLEQVEGYKFKARDIEQLKKSYDDLANAELEILNKTLPAENAFTVEAIRDAATKKVPLARPTIKAILAEPERVAAVLDIDGRLKETLRDEALTQLIRSGTNKKKLDTLKAGKQVFEQLLPNESSYDDLVDFYTAIEKSTAGDLVNNPAATLVALRGTQAVIQFGKEAIMGGGVGRSLARLGGNAVGGINATIAGNVLVKKILLNPKYSKIAIKAAQGKRLSNREVDRFILALTGSKILVQGLNEAGKPKDAGKTTVLRQTVAPSYPQD